MTVATCCNLRSPDVAPVDPRFNYEAHIASPACQILTQSGNKSPSYRWFSKFSLKGISLSNRWAFVNALPNFYCACARTAICEVRGKALSSPLSLATPYFRQRAIINNSATRIRFRVSFIVWIENLLRHTTTGVLVIHDNVSYSTVQYIVHSLVLYT